MSGLNASKPEAAEALQAIQASLDVKLGPALQEAGFRDLEFLGQPPLCAVRYKKDDMRFTIHFEYEDQLWATIDVHKASGWKQFSLDRALKKILPAQHRQLQKVKRSQLDTLAIYAKSIKEIIAALT